MPGFLKKLSVFFAVSLQRMFCYARQAGPFFKRVSVDFIRTRRLWRGRKSGVYRYTVVSAVYNAAPYLDDFFRSLTEQVLDFEHHIDVILVDDGSTDESSVVIKRWQKRYPRNISYLRKENGGQGSARNAGIPLVKTPWVSFIDPDDFVDVTYFSRVDAFFSKHHRENRPEAHINILGCNLIVYAERNGRFKDNHPLRGRFEGEPEKIFPCADMDEFMQLSASTAFFRTAEIERQNIRFDERRWPSFEDTHFVSRYLLGLTAGRTALARFPRYYYRKRVANDSSLNLARGDKRFYLEQIREALLGLFEQTAATHNGQIPEYIQRVAVYHLWWRIKDGMNFPAPVCLDEGEATQYFALLHQCFARITPAIVLSLPSFCPIVPWDHVVGILHFFHNTVPPVRKVFITRFDPVRRQACLTYQTGTVCEERIVSGREVLSIHDAKTTTQTFGGRVFCLHRQFWIDIPSGGSFEVFLDGETALLVLGETGSFIFRGNEIESYFAPPAVPYFAKRYARAWVLADRNDQADDNAEHLYRYIKHHHPEREIYFALQGSSHDWARLEREGFVLLRSGGWKYARVMQGCAMIISSHADGYLTKHAHHKPYVFLRHGVVVDNMSTWLNSKKFDLVLTSTRSEYDSIVKDRSPYFLSTRETRLTGLPRHDALVPFTGSHNNTLLVLPTWRKYLLGPGRRPLPDFMETTWARHWRSFLSSDALRRMAEVQGMRILFFLHPKMQVYSAAFDLPDYVETANHAGASIQELFKQATILVTDYSSVAFEMAFLKKTVAYYQFDRITLTSGKHTTLRGYFDYARDGFGPVAEDEETLLRNLEPIVRRGGAPEPEYLRRMEELFPHRDGCCCERVYKAIEDLEIFWRCP